MSQTTLVFLCQCQTSDAVALTLFKVNYSTTVILQILTSARRRTVELLETSNGSHCHCLAFDSTKNVGEPLTEVADTRLSRSRFNTFSPSLMQGLHSNYFFQLSITRTRMEVYTAPVDTHCDQPSLEKTAVIQP